MKKFKYFDLPLYKRVLTVALPIMIQNFITALANLVDNLMVGGLGDEAIAGLGVANSIFFVLLVVLFGVSETFGIYIAQFHGAKKYEMRNKVLSLGVLMTVGLAIVGVSVVLTFKQDLFLLYMDESAPIALGIEYMSIVAFAYLFIAFNISIGVAFRSIGQTRVVMKAGIIAIIINTILNFLLIYGIWFFPELGVKGAAIATLTSKIIEFLILLTILNNNNEGLKYKMFAFLQLKSSLVYAIIKKAIPLSLNEVGWAGGMAIMMALYGAHSYQDLVAVNIAYTVGQLFFVSMDGIGFGIAIVIGHQLGSGDHDNVLTTAYKIYFLGFFLGLIIMILFSCVAFIIPELYNIDQEVKQKATYVMIVMACFFPLFLLNTAFFFTLRTGGDTISILLFDGGIMYLLVIPLAFYIAYYTQLPIYTRYAILQLPEILKVGIGFYLVKRGKWIKNLAI